MLIIQRFAIALDLPFLLLPFRPTSDPSAVRTFIRHFFDQSQPVRGETLLQELRMAEPMVFSLMAIVYIVSGKANEATGYIWSRKMVLESSAGRRCWLGRL